MSINELMVYYLSGSKVANGGSVTGRSGSEVIASVETVGGQGYTKMLKARAWGQINAEPVVIMNLPGEKYYAVNYKTYREICDLLSRDLSNLDITEEYASTAVHPGVELYINIPGKPSVKAVAWYDVPLGKVKLFKVDGKQYAISLVASVLLSQRTLFERRTGNFATPNPKCEIVWHQFPLSGDSIPNFPNKPKHLI